jgi:hypothetical protein
LLGSLSQPLDVLFVLRACPRRCRFDGLRSHHRNVAGECHTQRHGEREDRSHHLTCIPILVMRGCKMVDGCMYDDVP